MAPSLLLALFALPAWAQSSTETAEGVVVKVDTAASAVYLDFGDKSTAKLGDSFWVYKAGDNLSNPLTGKPLGQVEVTVAQGTISEVHPLYALGKAAQPAEPLAPGMRARLSPQAKASAGQASGRDPRSKGPLFSYAARALAVADFSGAGALQAALADEKTVYLYPYPPSDSKPLSEYKLPGSASKVLSLEAADLNGNGRAELFVTTFNDAFTRVETLVLERDSEGRWAKLAEIPGAVRSLQLAKGRRVLAVQQLEEDRTFPFSNVYPLESRDGKYAAASPAIRFKRADWIYGFTAADLGGPEPALVALTAADLVRVDFPKGRWKSDEAYGQTPVRFTWSGRVLQCHPRMEERYGEKGFGGLYLVKNSGGFGALGAAFGYYTGGEIVRKDYDGLGLVTAWKAPVAGYSPAISLVKDPNGGGEALVAAVVGATGKTSLWTYDP